MEIRTDTARRAPRMALDYTHAQLLSGARALAGELAQWGLDWDDADERARNLAQVLAGSAADQMRSVLREFVEHRLAVLIDRQVVVLERAWRRGVEAAPGASP